MAAQSNITQGGFQAHAIAFAQAHNIDSGKAVNSFSDKAFNATVEVSYQEGITRGVARTPTVLVNGDPFIEAFFAADIIKSIEPELAAAKR
jgi:protein-disulfide isomerase